jgi:16S rRNA (cytosine967-C5)-methyltransferase
MTPGARVAAAIEVIDAMAGGLAAEQALTRWARASRFAGSKDRAAVRDHVFDLLRRRRSAAHRGGGESGRALMIGLLRDLGEDPASLFTGEGHAPAPLSAAEASEPAPPEAQGLRWNLPDWLLPEFENSLGEGAETAALALQARAPVFLRVHLGKGSRAAAREKLAAEGIETLENDFSESALTVTEGARRIRNSQAFAEGYVELQDAASQAVTDLLPPVARALDYCAGGGGKALAMAARGATVLAHDADPGRMVDLPARAARAGTPIATLTTAELPRAAPFELVLCDAPCSGSGAWRRAPGGKWRLTPEGLAALCDTQDAILDQAAALVAPGGTLAYATCSLLRCENEDRVAAFLARQEGWEAILTRRIDVSEAGDGFFTAQLKRATD